MTPKLLNDGDYYYYYYYYYYYHCTDGSDSR